MILRSICIENWRCLIDPVHIGPLSEGINILHAPNATGKSTVFEALRRSLFDSHDVTGQNVSALQPWGRSLAPTVQVEFAHGSTEYRLQKRFLESPSSTLERLENGAFVRLAAGRQADQHLRELFSCTPPGRGFARPENWGLAQVLWAPQGDLSLSKLSGNVVTDIRTSISVQVSGANGGPIEQRIKQLFEQHFTPTGRPKARSKVPELQEELGQARLEHQKALERLQEFETASLCIEELRAQREHELRQVEALDKELQSTAADVQTYKNLESRKKQCDQDLETARKRRDDLQLRITHIGETRKTLIHVRGTLQSLEIDIPLAQRELDERTRQKESARRATDDARGERQKADAIRKEAGAALEYSQSRERLSALVEQLKRLADVEETLTELRARREEIIAPDADTLRALRKAVGKLATAQNRLDASLITLELVPIQSGELQVVVGEEVGPRSLQADHALQIKGTPEVVVDLPGFARIRAWGPAESASELRNKRDNELKVYRALAAPFGTDDLEEIEALVERAQTLDQNIRDAVTQQELLLAGSKIEGVRELRNSEEVIVRRLEQTYPNWTINPPDPRALGSIADELGAKVDHQLLTSEADWDTARDAEALAQQRLAALDSQQRELLTRSATLEQDYRQLTEDGKSDAERDDELRQQASRVTEIEAQGQKLTAELQQFPEDLLATVDVLEQQRRAAAVAEREALSELNRAEGRIELLSAEGPYSLLAIAEERVSTVESQLQREELRAEAIRLLNSTVSSCHQATLSAVSGPVEAVASHTLRRIGGDRLGGVKFEDGFVPGSVIPALSANPVSLEQVSGGEREQVNLATRLALAAVLARDERQLVVLDDVLTFTDAGRLARILGIFKEAAARLQLLIITCHPERYRGLSEAHFIDLSALTRKLPVRPTASVDALGPSTRPA